MLVYLPGIALQHSASILTLASQWFRIVLQRYRRCGYEVPGVAQVPLLVFT
jgi:hypothetical protein